MSDKAKLWQGPEGAVVGGQVAGHWQQRNGLSVGPEPIGTIGTIPPGNCTPGLCDISPMQAHPLFTARYSVLVLTAEGCGRQDDHLYVHVTAGAEGCSWLLSRYGVIVGRTPYAVRILQALWRPLPTSHCHCHCPTHLPTTNRAQQRQSCCSLNGYGSCTEYLVRICLWLSTWSCLSVASGFGFGSAAAAVAPSHLVQVQALFCLSILVCCPATTSAFCCTYLKPLFLPLLQPPSCRSRSLLTPVVLRLTGSETRDRPSLLSRWSTPSKPHHDTAPQRWSASLPPVALYGTNDI